MSAAITTRVYRGSLEDATRDFQHDAAMMAKEGWIPTSQSYQPGSWSCGAFLVALLLCIILIGILVFIYMIIVKPAGTLTVTYQRQGLEEPTKVCPRCAETIKRAANVCRFCGYEYVWAPTHRVPESGIPAWNAPDPSLPPAHQLVSGLGLVVSERSGDWAHVEASNGWTGWVDGRLLLAQEAPILTTGQSPRESEPTGEMTSGESGPTGDSESSAP